MKGPLPGALAPITVPASWLYGLAVAARNARYDRGRLGARLAVPVISVGNITAGGAGKSPMVRHIARRLLELGRRPVIALRGYGARPGECSDEEREHREALPEVPVVADPDRAAALRRFLQDHPGADCALLDDAFQHRQLARDLDLVLIDATRATFRDRLLPRGWLREPLRNLRRAGAVAITRAERVDPRLAGEVEAHHGRPPVAWCRHAWTGLAVMGAEAPRRLEVAWLRGKRVVTMLGIGHPESVRAQLREAGASITADVAARDHERYQPAKIARVRRLCEGVEALVMTAKDWARARGQIEPRSWPSPVVVPCLEIEIFDGRAALERLIADTIRFPSSPCPA